MILSCMLYQLLLAQVKRISERSCISWGRQDKIDKGTHSIEKVASSQVT